MIYLASRSPQRRNLLKSAGISFRIVRTKYRETLRPRLSPSQNALRHAEGKVKGVSKKSGIIIGADTLVVCRGRVYGKPRNRRQALRMLRAFSGRSQWIYTAVAIQDRCTGKVLKFVDKSVVRFKKMTDRDIQSYLKTGEYKGKAGSFGLQGKGSHLINSIRGSRSSIIGLPIEKLTQALKQFI